MRICHCKLVNDRMIREAIVGGARTVAQVGRACGAATGCGGCAPAVSELIEQRRTEQVRLELPLAAE